MDFEKLLIFRIGNLGDTLVSLPALWAVRKAFPNARLTLLFNADPENIRHLSASKVLPETGLIDEWIPYTSMNGKISSFFAMAKLVVELKRRKFDHLVYLMPRIRTIRQIDRDIRFFKFAGISKFIGVNYLRENRLDPVIPEPIPFIESESTYLLNCLSFDGISIGETDLTPDLLLTEAEHRSAKQWFQKAAGIHTGERKLIAVAPGSKWESKIWAEERFESVVRRLISEHAVFPVVFGGAEDREKGNRLIAAWGTGTNSAGQLSVRESAALLRECKLYLGNDTGTMHLAAAVETACVAIFAAVDWRGRWTPFGLGHQIFRQTVKCEGCHTPDCFNAHKCLEMTTVSEVHAACSRILNTL